MGIDILPGYSPNSTKLPHYAVVVLRDGHIVGKYDDLPLNKVLRLVLEYHVDVIAIDNVYELVRNNRDLVKLASLLPPSCKIVQVTGLNDGIKGVNEIARELGLQISKPSPLYTAFINAYAVYNGYGQELRVFGNKTLLIITKGRSVSQGGMSSDRFRRSIRASILHVTKEVRKTLDENKIDYDIVLRKSEGGLERSVFIVYAPRERLYGLIKPIKHKNIKIIIRPIPARNTPVNTASMRPIIVGLDPGMSIGIAVLDIYGRPIHMASVKSPDRDEVLRQISQHGDVVILATDMSKPPDFVKKITGLLNAILYTPESDIPVSEKNKVVKDIIEKYGIEIPDTHVRDALVAAVKAYHSVKNVIEEIMAKIEGIPGIDKERIVTEVIRGKPLSEVLDEYFMKTLGVYDQNIFDQYLKDKAQSTSVDENAFNKLREKIYVLENTIKKLEEELRKKELLISNMETEIKLMRTWRPGIDEYERRISLLTAEIDHLKRKLEVREREVELLREKIRMLENTLISLGKGELVLIPKYSSLSRVDICSFKLPGVYIDVIDISGFNKLYLSKESSECIKNNRMFLVIRDDAKLDYNELDMPIVKVKDLLELNDYVLVKSDVIAEAEKQWKEIERRRVEKTHENIIKMIEEYQRSRRKLV